MHQTGIHGADVVTRRRTLDPTNGRVIRSTEAAQLLVLGYRYLHEEDPWIVISDAHHSFELTLESATRLHRVLQKLLAQVDMTEQGVEDD